MPPVTEILIAPSDPDLQDTFVFVALAILRGAVGCETAIAAGVYLQPFES